MTRFIKSSILIASIVVLGCVPKKVNDNSLPFFNDPDFTPEWIDKSSIEFSKIHTIPRFTFTNQSGEKVTEEDVSEKIFVANFMFTSCISICPLMTVNMKTLQTHFANDPDVILLSHSVMPDIDSVATLQKYAKQKGIIPTKWHLLTGNRDSIYAIAKKHYFAGDSIGFYGNQRDFLHTENFILIDKHRRIRGVYNGTLRIEMERVIDDINTLKKER